MTERLYKAESQYREITNNLGVELKVIKAVPISQVGAHDLTRYEFELNIDSTICHFALVDNDRTIVTIDDINVESFNFYAKKSSFLNYFLFPKKHIKIKNTYFSYNGNNERINEILTSGDILNGFFEMANAINLSSEQNNTSEEILDTPNPVIRLTIFNVPMNSAKLDHVIQSISNLIKKIR